MATKQEMIDAIEELWDDEEANRTTIQNLQMLLEARKKSEFQKLIEKILSLLYGPFKTSLEVLTQVANAIWEWLTKR
jgi:hypothetical protein